MLERVIDDWLDSSTERGFQLPVSHILQAQGHKLIHLTRHCAMEMGKDIITIDPDGIPCAFQLKTAEASGRFTLSQWRQISGQLDDLVNNAIDHPLVDRTVPHRSFLVTNGNLDEEVSIAIRQRNEAWQARGQSGPKLEVLIKGDILDGLKQLGLNFWPTELREVKTFLEIFLEAGNGLLPKDKFSNLMMGVLPLPSDKSPRPSLSEATRKITSVVLLSCLAIHSFSERKNHLAEISAWTIVFSHICAFVEAWNLPVSSAQSALQITSTEVYNALGRLCDEVRTRKLYVEGNALADRAVYEIRLTYLIGLMSIFHMWSSQKESLDEETDNFIRNYCRDKRRFLSLWGESAVPLFWAHYIFWRSTDASKAPDQYLERLLAILLHRNAPHSTAQLAGPYYSEQQCFLSGSGSPEWLIEDTVKGQSYTIDSIFYALVRRNWKQLAIQLWAEVSKITVESFWPTPVWRYYLWRSNDGDNKSEQPVQRKLWADLKREATERDFSALPEILRDYPAMFFVFLVVYPHRFRNDAARFLDHVVSGV